MRAESRGSSGIQLHGSLLSVLLRPRSCCDYCCCACTRRPLHYRQSRRAAFVWRPPAAGEWEAALGCRVCSRSRAIVMSFVPVPVPLG